MQKRSLKSLIPSRVRSVVKDFLGISGLEERLNQFENLISKELSDKSKTRWRGNEPFMGLTWNKEVNGDNFISKVSSYDAFDSNRAVLEIGPGYGRLLNAMMGKEVPFKNYLGVDLSRERVAYLKETFSNGKIDFIEGDIEKIALNEMFDLVISSLTFKHLYPTFETGLDNVTNHVNAGGMLFFDLVEGDRKYFEDNGTYLHLYSKSEISGILGRTNLELIAFDQVEHDPEHLRLLVIAKKMGDST